MYAGLHVLLVMHFGQRVTDTMKGILWLSLDHQISPVEVIHNPVNHFHVTLQFGVDLEDWAHLIDQHVELVAVANCYNSKVQALRVILPPDFDTLCANDHPHMTISTADNVRPVESNNMLASEHNEERIEFVMQTTVEFFEFKK
jgi:hypothetical protein